MDPKKKRAVTLACDMVTLNYLRNHGFDILASQFQASRQISTTVAGAFKTMTLERISGFIEKKSQNQTSDNQNRFHFNLLIFIETRSKSFTKKQQTFLFV
jgi:hypothetical protein